MDVSGQEEVDGTASDVDFAPQLSCDDSEDEDDSDAGHHDPPGGEVVPRGRGCRGRQGQGRGRGGRGGGEQRQRRLDWISGGTPSFSDSWTQLRATCLPDALRGMQEPAVPTSEPLSLLDEAH